MDAGPTLKRKVTVQLNYKPSSSSRPPSRNNSPSRPASPTKSYVSMNPSIEPTSRPKAKVNSSATTRKLAAGSAASGSTTSTPRAGSPAKLTPRLRNGVTSPTHKPQVPSGGGARSPPPASASANPEFRNRSQTTTMTTSSSLSPLDDSRSRAGSVSSLHHAVSFSSFPPPPSSNLSISTRPGSASVNSSPRLAPSKSARGLSERERNTSSPTLRIRSKVTAMAKASSESPSPSPISSPTSPPSQPTSLAAHPPQRTRVASISSHIVQKQALSTSPPMQFYPITTAVPAANPHRFASTRPASSRGSPPVANHIFQSFGQKPSTTLSVAASDDARPSSPARPRKARISSGVQAKVDPASIPLPPTSPPASAVSFSSRSSVSRSSASVSYVGGSTNGLESQTTSTSGAGSSRLSPSTQHGPDENIDQLKATLDNLMQYTSTLDDSGMDSGHDRDTDEEMEGAEDHKVRAAAKSNRKIADLEITNRSLLAINATLEATKHRQAKEIRELRRKLRESRLILPPRTFRAVKSSLTPAEVADDEEDVDEEEEEDNAESGEATAGEGDETYQRIKLILDSLLKDGQRALETQVRDYPAAGKSSAKVLTAEELRDWHGADADGHDDEHNHDFHDNHDLQHDELHEHELDEMHSDIHGGEQYDDEDIFTGDMSFDEAIGNETTISEDEVVAMMMIPPTSPPPPILITQPS